MHTFKRLLAIARPYLGKLLLATLLTSVGALAELVEPWVYRAIVNDIAGVFVSRETNLLRGILEELRGGGESEPEPEAPPSSPVAKPDPPPPEPQAKIENRKPAVATSQSSIVNRKSLGAGRGTSRLQCRLSL